MRFRFLYRSLSYSRCCLRLDLGGITALASHGFDVFYDGVRIVAFVGQHRLGFAFTQQCDGLGAVVDLATGQQKT